MSQVTRFTPALILALVAPFAAAQTLAPTRVVKFTAPKVLPQSTKTGECTASSVAASFRKDAVRCTAGTTAYDPCFVTAQSDRVLCDVDPRNPSSGVLLVVPDVPRPSHTASPDGRVWFFELADGSTCQPLVAGARRDIEGLVEMYTCKFGSSGDADAVLGDLDTSEPVWTIQKVLINKKVDPQTIKSATAAPVNTAWQ